MTFWFIRLLILANAFIWNFKLPIEHIVSQTQQKQFLYALSSVQNWALVEKKLRYPLPRQMFREGDLSVRMNRNENIGNNKFNATMNLAKT